MNLQPLLYIHPALRMMYGWMGWYEAKNSTNTDIFAQVNWPISSSAHWLTLPTHLRFDKLHNLHLVILSTSRHAFTNWFRSVVDWLPADVLSIISYLTFVITDFFLPFNFQAKKDAAAKPTSSSGGKKAKKKWSAKKVKDKSNNMVVLDKQTYERVFKEVPTYKFISQSVLVDRLRLNGSLARVAIRELEDQGVIRRITRHASQVIYSKYMPCTFILPLSITFG